MNELIPAHIIRSILLFAPPFIISLSFHEYAHAWVADKLGDQTARFMGRLTMDPMAHISWMGTVIFPAVMMLIGGPLFGWANPVPVDMRNFKNPRGHMALVACAGPASNILLAFLTTALIALLIHTGQITTDAAIEHQGMAGAAFEMLVMMVQLNLFLAFFNLIPLPPLDGSRIVQGFSSREFADAMDRYGPQIQLVLFFVLFLGPGRIVGRVLSVPVEIAFRFLLGLFRIG